MSMEDCLFCKIIAREIPAEIVYENEKTLAFLDIGPVSKGHTLVIPKTHATHLSEGTQEDALALMSTIHLLAPKMAAALEATGYNLGMNQGADAGQDVFHTHIHIMPRYAGDLRKFVKMHPSKEELHEVGELIRASV